MNKVFGSKSLYAPIRDDYGRSIVCYDYKDEPDGENGTWREIVFYKKINPILNIDLVKNAIVKDINSQTDNKILTGFKWTILEGEDAGKEVDVWLSQENQFNYKAAYDLAANGDGFLPVTFKFGTDEEPVYHTFTDVDELEDFYVRAIEYINSCLVEGWNRKDSIDWSVYEEALNK